MKTKITCDQVAWLLDVFNRHLPPSPHVAISAARECQMHAMLYEVMEVAGLEFEDASAAWNAIPKRWQHFGPKEATDADVGRVAVDAIRCPGRRAHPYGGLDYMRRTEAK